MLTEQHKLSNIGNELIKDNVGDILSEIVEENTGQALF